jgi:hypothetical protein
MGRAAGSCERVVHRVEKIGKRLDDGVTGVRSLGLYYGDPGEGER